MTKYQQILQEYWHYDDFRPLQAEIIDSVGQGKDTLALMPTGGGKSLCFQVPAMAMCDPCDSTQEGLCLVITPLIALMKDQVQNLRDKGIKAYAIYAGLNHREISTILENCQLGGYKFLYVSPERLESSSFRKRITELPICMIAVDEAHCISQWGYDFRPPYLRIASIREVLQERLRRYKIDARIPVLALTATATPEVVEDIQKRLAFEQPNVFKKSFRRENLSYVVRYCDEAKIDGNAWHAKMAEMLHILQCVPGSSVVYVRNRQKTVEVAEWLQSQQIKADFYHAGISNIDKDKKQTSWKKDETRVIVATNAFGMGIDKPDVRTVIHLDLPDTLEAYFQEAGRAGRDGKRAYAILLYNKEDQTKAKKRVTDNYPDRDFILKVYDTLGNYLQVGLASGLDHTFAFPLEQFCIEKKLPIMQTFSALQILTQAGYIAYIDEHETQPRVQIQLTREELYQEQISDTQERILNTLMRRYTGIFTEPAYIYDEQLAKEMELDKKELNHQLVLLAQQGIITYIPRRKTPYISYTQERLQLDYIKLPKECLEDRQEHFEKKIRAMVEYAEQDQFCRSQLLQSYFGELDSEPCECCDICLRKKKEETQE